MVDGIAQLVSSLQGFGCFCDLLSEGDPVTNLDEMAEELFGVRRGIDIELQSPVAPPAAPSFGR